MEATQSKPDNNKFRLDDILNLEIFKIHPKLLIRLKINVEQLNFYEAHQIYKTLHFRCMNSNLFDDSLELIFNGICFFLENNQHLEGYDLSKTFLEILNKSKIQSIETKLLKKVERIHQLLKGEERQDFTANILKWSQNLNSKNTNNLNSYTNDLHRVFALSTWKEKNYIQSRYHFLHSIDGESCAQMLINYHIEQGYNSEIDLFITQTVLQYLCLKNHKTALVVFQVYTEKHPKLMTQSPPYSLPLLNFIWFLLSALKDGQSSVFKVLCNLYGPSIKRDPSFSDYLDKIGAIYFNIKSKRRESENPLNQIFKMFMQPDPNETISTTTTLEENEQYLDLDDNELD